MKSSVNKCRELTPEIVSVYTILRLIFLCKSSIHLFVCN